MGDKEYALTRRLTSDQLVDQIGLPVQPVVVVPWLLGEPEAEEVRRQDGLVGLTIEQPAPVVGARGEPMQEEQERSAALAGEDVDATAAELFVGAALLPGADVFGQLGRPTSSSICIRSRFR
jgi:hypothetical protein